MLITTQVVLPHIDEAMSLQCFSLFFYILKGRPTLEMDIFIRIQGDHHGLDCVRPRRQQHGELQGARERFERLVKN